MIDDTIQYITIFYICKGLVDHVMFRGEVYIPVVAKPLRMCKYV